MDTTLFFIGTLLVTAYVVLAEALVPGAPGIF